MRIDSDQKIFETRDEDEVIALQEHEYDDRTRRVRRRRRPERLRQEHAPLHGCRDRETDQGTILIDDKPLNGPNPRTSVVFQSDYLLPWRTVIDNVLLLEIKRLNVESYRERAKSLLAQVGLAGFGTVSRRALRRHAPARRHLPGRHPGAWSAVDGRTFRRPRRL